MRMPPAGWTSPLIEGSERKTTGSYYTPPQLVAELIKSALDPVIADRLATAAPDGEPGTSAAVNSRVRPGLRFGPFPARRSPSHRQGAGAASAPAKLEPAPEHMREAIRDVIAHCIYGVDKNPLAVDLCRVALFGWRVTPAASRSRSSTIGSGAATR